MSHRRYHSDWELEQRADSDPVRTTAFAGAEVFQAGSGSLPFSYKNISLKNFLNLIDSLGYLAHQSTVPVPGFYKYGTGTQFPPPAGYRTVAVHFLTEFRFRKYFA